MTLEKAINSPTKKMLHRYKTKLIRVPFEITEWVDGTAHYTELTCNKADIEIKKHKNLIKAFEKEMGMHIFFGELFTEEKGDKQHFYYFLAGMDFQYFGKK